MSSHTLFWLRNAGLLLALGAMWGSAFLMIDVALEVLTPTQIATGRLGTAALFFTAYLAWKRGPLPRGIGLWLVIAGIAFCGNIIPFWMISWGQQHVPTGVVATIMGFVPLVTAAMAHFFLKDERFTLMTGIGLAFGLGGVFVLLGRTDLMALGNDAIAEIAVLIAATGYAATNIIARKAGSAPARTIGFGAMWIGTGVLLPGAFAEGHNIVHLDWETAGAIVYLGVVSTALPTILLLHLVRTVGATFTAYANYLVPAIGVFLGVAVLDETLTAGALIALGLILAGIALGQIGKSRS